MDNFEQLLTELGAEALAELLADASHVKLLATSREPLDLQEEWRRPVIIMKRQGVRQHSSYP
jgi:hypothetical protein